jgi:DNA-damage-inducible protein D
MVHNNQSQEKRMRGIAIRDELTEEWKKRGVQESKDFAILTAEISKATFGMTPTEYQKHKGLRRENLRDHMTDLALIFLCLVKRLLLKLLVIVMRKALSKTEP